MTSSRLVPEWQRQDAIIIVWPHPYSDWIDNLVAIEKTYLELTYCISRHQRLILVAHDAVHELHIRHRLEGQSINSGNITFTTIPTDDVWIRDYGPICTVSDNGLNVLDFVFDGWGQKYRHEQDNAFNARLIKRSGLKGLHSHVDQVLEAGNIEINGRGELLCSSLCFRRNGDIPDFDTGQLEKKFAAWFGSVETYWIDDVRLQGDDTDGHIDTLARFCTDDVMVYSAPGHKNDANNEALKQLAMQLHSIKKRNNKIELVPLPLPDPIFLSGKQLPASYTNFLITNKSVLVPTFNDKRDGHALKVLEELLPTREIVEIDSTVLIQQRGGLHCATMQLPENILE